MATEDPYFAALYDRLAVDRGDEDYYLHLVSSAQRVLDVGCGTGTLLHRAREAGHQGRLVGLDPDEDMLNQARTHPGVEWVSGYLPDAGFEDDFDLVFMTGHAFQVLLTDDEVRTLLRAVHIALAPGGRFAFETRNPLYRAWEKWTPEHARAVEDADGHPVRVWHEVEKVDGEHVTFTETYASPDWSADKVSRCTLRFLPAGELDHLLTEAGFVIDERYGFWDRSLFTAASPEIITIASAH